MLTATISHDMRTPLNAILGLSKVVETYIDKEEGKKLLRIMDSSSLILLFLVNDLLDLFKMRNNKFAKNEHETNIVACV